MVSAFLSVFAGEYPTQMLILIENLALIHNQLVHGFKTADGFVFSTVEEKPH
jgi:hypothetical protein